MTAGEEPGAQRKHSPARRTLGHLVALLAVLQCGCAATPPRLLSGPDQQQLGTIGVVAANYAPDVRIRGPGQRGGKAGILVGGLGAAAATVASCLNPLAFLTCPTMLVTMGALGATAGGVIGHQIDSRITGAGISAATPETLDGPQAQIALRDWIVRHARATTPHQYVALDDPAPRNRSDRPDYRALAGRGIDTVLEVSLLELRMEGRPMQGLFLSMASRVRYVRAGNGAVMGEGVVRHRSEAHPYERWTDKDAELFRKALESGFQHAADLIARDVSGSERDTGPSAARPDSAAARR